MSLILTLMPLFAAQQDNVVWIQETPSFEWQRHKCEICGKTIWEKVEYTSTADGAIAISLAIDTVWGDAISLGDEPERTEAKSLAIDLTYKFCPRCFYKYDKPFDDAMRKAAEGFIADAKVKEADRIKTVAQENTQEEFRRIEDQLRQYREQVKKLTEQITTLKARLKE